MVEPKFKQGDKVRIGQKPDVHWTSGMTELKGTIVTIDTIGKDEISYIYTIKEHRWHWRETDFVEVEERKEPLFKIVDVDFKEIEQFLAKDFTPTPMKTATMTVVYDAPNRKVTCKEVPAAWCVVVYQKECLECGTHSERDAKYCRKCGKPLIW